MSQTQSQPPPQVKTPGNKRPRANSIGPIGAAGKRQKGAKQQQQQSSADGTHTDYVAQAIDALIAAGHVTSSSSSSSSSEVSALKQELGALKDVVQRQQQTITVLEQRINDLLSAFGLPTTAAAAAVASSAAVSSLSTSTDISVPVITATAAVPSSTASSSFSKAVATKPSPRTIRETIVAAVYIDKAASDRRSSSFIVSGMPPSSSCDDRTTVTDLCHREIGLRPEVTATKRLGQPRPDRVQPILVHVKHTEEARQIISQAKKLRQSPDLHVKQHVFINANLTQAEARAAYEMRCRRRQAASNSDSSGNNMSNPNPMPSTSNVSHGASLVPPSLFTTAAFNPTAPVFNPTS